MRADDSTAMIVETDTEGLAAEPAVLAIPATDIVADNDPLTGADPFDPLPQFRHCTCRPVSHDARQFHGEGPAAAKFHLKKIHADCADAQQHFADLGLRRRDCLPLQIFRRSEIPEDNGLHPGFHASRQEMTEDLVYCRC